MKEKREEKAAQSFFQTMERRRVSCPQVTQQLWDVIKSLRNARQVPTSERIQKLMQKDYGTNESEVTRQLEYCVRDGLLELTKRTVSKGTKAGSEQQWYTLPTLKLKDDDYDWYCFACHSPGDVIKCTKSGCLKVYHLACQSNPDRTPFICEVCTMCQKNESKLEVTRSRLNRILGLGPLAKLKSKYPLTLKDQRLPPPKKNILVSDRVAQALPPTLAAQQPDEEWRTFFLIAREMNLTIVEEKIDRHRYRTIEEFSADCQNIVHNIIIYNGVHSAVADIARQMLRDCEVELEEIRKCVDCYHFSHGHKKQWFAKACNKAHDLVYVKQSGQPYWPAKVIKEDGDVFDVRLFGPPHPRIQVQRSLVKPISVNIHTLQIKRSSNWNRASDEMKKYQEAQELHKIESNNYSKPIYSSSSDESEPVNSDTQRKMERDWRISRIKSIIDKEGGNLKQKQKVGAKRRSSSTAPQGERKRGRPRLSDAPSHSKSLTPKSSSRPSRKRTYSSDSLDSFNAPDPSPKKNTDEMFDELLKSEPAKTTVGTDKLKKDVEPLVLRRTPGRPATSKPDKVHSEDSKTLDGSTISSHDTDTSRARSSSVRAKKYSSSDDSDSDSDVPSSVSTKKPVNKRPRPLKKKPESLKRKDISDDESTTSDTDSDLPKKGNRKEKPNGKLADSSSSSSDSDSDDDDDDEDDDETLKPKSKKPVPPKTPTKPPATPKPKTPLRKISISSGSSLESTKALRSKARVKDSKKQETSESTDVDVSAAKKPVNLPVPVPTARPTRGRPPSTSKAETATPPQRTSQRTQRKSADHKDDENAKEGEDSSDSEAPLKQKKPEVRDILRKYTNRLDPKPEIPVSSDSDSKSNKLDSDSETDVSEQKANPKKDDRKGRTVAPASAAPEQRKARTSRDAKESFKDARDEIVVSSSSQEQEPVTRSVYVQTEGFSRYTPELKHRAERVMELEKQLQLQVTQCRKMEAELEKTKLVLEGRIAECDEEIADMANRHAINVSEIKKKQWCYNCETEAIYHCCWNTAYCSVECQQAHWQSEHKRVCRRKR